MPRGCATLACRRSHVIGVGGAVRFVGVDDRRACRGRGGQPLRERAPAALVAARGGGAAGPRGDCRASVRPVIAIVAVWALVRLLLLPVIDPVLMAGDDVDYVAMARSFIASGNFADARTMFSRPPGYPLFLAATLWLGPAGIFALQS